VPPVHGWAMSRESALDMPTARQLSTR